MRIGYADPPYVGQSLKHYGNHKDFAGEVDHALLISELVADFDGFVLHCTSTSLGDLLDLAPSDVRVGAWVKPFAAFKKNVPVAYAWEPIIFKPARKQSVHGTTRPLRDFISEPITMKRGLAGAKPRKVCWWAFECIGCEPTDDLVDLFPGTGAVAAAWNEWRDLTLNKPIQGGLFEATV